MSALRPNYRRARELKSEIQDLTDDLQWQREQGLAHDASNTLAALNEAQAELFRCGVPSEYDL
jgi:hypothetical protein